MNQSGRHISKDLAMQCMREGRFEDCIECAKEMAAANPQDQRCYSIMGAAYTELGEIDKAIEAFRQALGIEPSARAHYNLGKAYEQTHNVQAALDEYHLSVELDPSYRPALDALKRLDGGAKDDEKDGDVSVSEYPPPDGRSKEAQESLLDAVVARNLDKEEKIRQVHNQMMKSGLIYGMLVGPVGLMGALFIARFFIVQPISLVWGLVAGVIFGAIVGFWTGYTSGDDMTGAKAGATLGCVVMTGIGLFGVAEFGIGFVIAQAAFGLIIGGVAGFFIGMMVENSIGWN